MYYAECNDLKAKIADQKNAFLDSLSDEQKSKLTLTYKEYRLNLKHKKETALAEKAMSNVKIITFHSH